MTILFTIPLIPRGQARARAYVKGKHASVYKPDSQRHQEDAIMTYLAHYAPTSPSLAPIALEFVAYLPCPISKPAKWRKAALAGEIYPTTKPDTDNLAKMLKDCMTTMRYWHDDKQVVVLNAAKRYSDNPRWEVTLSELG